MSTSCPGRFILGKGPRPLYPRERTPVPLQYEAGWDPAPVWTIPEKIKYIASYGDSNPGLKPTFVQRHSRPKFSYISFPSSSSSSSITSLVLLKVGPQLTRFLQVTRLWSTLTYKKGSCTNSNLVFTRQYIPNYRTLKKGVGSCQ